MGVLFVCSAVGTAAFAGPEPYSGKEMKQVAPAPVPECNWTGFYIGINVGGQWGHSEDTDLSDWNFPDREWGYNESGVVAGGQVGYNFQWNWLVLGIEGDLGYMSVDGRGQEIDQVDSHGESDSDFYTTIRGRLGLAWRHWLFYGTGGGIGVNYTTRFHDTGADNGNVLDARSTDFDWGWTGGGGIEYMFGCHWTARFEYLRYQLDDQHFSGVFDGTRLRFNGITEGNIVRAGLNYKF